MEHRCQCCQTINTRAKCSYCGFTEIVDMDEFGADTIISKVAVHRHNLTCRIRDIQVLTHLYQWNPRTRRLEETKEELLRLADGADCRAPYWSSAAFGQTTPGKEICLTLRYTLEGGSPQSCTCQARITPIAANDFWKIGLFIGPNLHLQVLLGSENQYAVSQQIPLEFQ